MREIVYCPNCGYTGSVEKGDFIPDCPECSAALVKMNISKEEWDRLSDHEKKAKKAELKDQKNDIVYLAQIASSVKSIDFWVKLWSVLSLIGICIIALQSCSG